jgi:hypothetical protein
MLAHLPSEDDMLRFPPCAAALVMLTAVGCAEAPTQLQRASSPSSNARANPTGCVVPATTTVGTEAALHGALATAAPGDVIAVQGTIALTDTAYITTQGVTLTCSSAGDGLVVASGPIRPGRLIVVYGSDVTVQGLALDGGQFAIPLFALRNGNPLFNATRLTFRGNRVRCSSNCLFLIATNHALVSDNSFEPNAGFAGGTGIHLQETVIAGVAYQIDSTRIERNVLTTAFVNGNPTFGAIRPRGGRDVVVRDNRIIGPWSNGIAATSLHGSVIEGNVIDGPTRFGLMVGSTADPFVQVSGLLAKQNAIANTGINAVFVNQTCGSVFLANKLATHGVANVFFTATSGANVLLGEKTTSIDNGVRDCDGDGLPDPNFLSAGGKPGAAPGPVMSTVMPHAADLDHR